MGISSNDHSDSTHARETGRWRWEKWEWRVEWCEKARDVQDSPRISVNPSRHPADSHETGLPVKPAALRFRRKSRLQAECPSAPSPRSAWRASLDDSFRERENTRSSKPTFTTTTVTGGLPRPAASSHAGVLLPRPEQSTTRSAGRIFSAPPSSAMCTPATRDFVASISSPFAETP